MKEFKVIRFLDKFRGLYEKVGVDYDIFRIILQAKLTMDGRRKATVFNNESKKKNRESNEFYKALILYAFIGLFFGLMLIFKMNLMYQMAAYFSAIMFMILTIFISDFSYVILDVRDKNILATKGVSSKTINAAKITHICIYIIYLTLALAGISLIISFKQGIGYFLIFLIEIILIDIFMIIITALSYLLVLKIFDGEKLKDMINFVQIGLSIFMVVIYQIIPRIFQFIDVGNITYTEKIWHILIPPIWFAAPLSMVAGEGITTYKIIMTVLAVLIPIIALLAYLKLTPTFEKYLQKLNNNNEKSNEKSKTLLRIGKIICKDKVERAFYNLSLGIINSEREFKLKVYPNMALGIIFPFIFMTIGLQGEGISDIRNSLINSKFYLSIYSFALMIPNILIMLRYSERYNGAWIYEVAPIKKISSIYKGVIKGALFKLIIPPYIIISIIFIAIFSPSVIKHIIVAFLALILITMVDFSVNSKVYPFSKKFEGTNNTGDSIVSFMISFMFILIGIGIHFATSFFSIGIYIYGAILLVLDILLWKVSFNISKKKLRE
ncbi:hypothetical protein PMY38_02180 [Clostridium tertium]|uniref:hypothetical protein n=1 Tax=Clostridium tertium TaxID=1559 RepID=UPI002029929A|nr:hypothetical protein [Clostridium tertium]MDB1954020.1 hypothetical protein [Clostridium tertium]MDB1957394.1 hypothetical protein [Clostridium tertium]MDB1960685.1 hypothetical protein [Clostridium tertium]MDB1965234.1 hypothetical protein [Clostridium tertium]